MATKRRKVYRPKPINPLGGMTAIALRRDIVELQQPMSEEQITDLAVAYRLAFTQMTNGNASEEHWCVVVCSLNIAMVLAERGYGPECIPEINDALEGAFRARVRANRTGAWGFDGPAIQAITNAFAIHEQQIEVATKAELRDALHEVHRRADEGNVFEEAA